MELNIFVPITKIDVAKRLVYGAVASETPDKSGESMDYKTAKPEFAKWSADIAKVTEGKSVGNMRVMHGNKVAGKFTDIAFDDDNKRIEMCGKVVDDVEWNNVLEGCYTGFSMGGSYLKRWVDGDVTKYTPRVAEVSLVDNPCIPDATFSVVKADGSIELKKFIQHKETTVTQPTNDQVAARAREMAKAAGDETKWASHVEEARAEFDRAADPLKKTAPVTEVPVVVGETDNTIDVAMVTKTVADDFGVEQVWKSKDGTTFKKKADALAHNEKLATDEAIAKAVAPVTEVIAEINAALGKTDVVKDDDMAQAAPGAGTGAADGEDPDTATKIAAVDGNAGNNADVPAAGTDAGPKVVTGGDTAVDADKDKELATRSTAETTKAATPLGLKKGLWIVSCASDLLSQINSICDAFADEQFWEQDMDAAPVVAQFKAWVMDGAKLLQALVVEETQEIIQDGGDIDDGILALYAAPGKKRDALVKLFGASKVGVALEKATQSSDTRVQSMHDNAVELGATCEHAEKSAATGELKKMAAERDGLQKSLGELGNTLKDVLERVKKVEAQPMPGGAIRNNLTTLDKSVDSGLPAADPTFEARLAKMTSDQISMLLIKLSQQNGQKFGPQGT